MAFPTLEDVKNDAEVKAWLKASSEAMLTLEYTEHGERHLSLVSNIARNVAREVGLTPREQELCAVAGYLHDIGNIIGRTQHQYWGAIITKTILDRLGFSPEEFVEIAAAISSHDKQQPKIINKTSAVLILADKSDVHRSRVPRKDIALMPGDIHTRVNYAVTRSFLEVESKSKKIVLEITIDTKITPVMEYFVIFTARMLFCRQAAKYLGYQFGLEINKTQLL